MKINERCGYCSRLKTCIKLDKILVWEEKEANWVFGKQLDVLKGLALLVYGIRDKLILSLLCDNGNIVTLYRTTS